MSVCESVNIVKKRTHIYLQFCTFYCRPLSTWVYFLGNIPFFFSFLVEMFVCVLFVSTLHDEKYNVQDYILFYSRSSFTFFFSTHILKHTHFFDYFFFQSKYLFRLIFFLCYALLISTCNNKIKFMSLESVSNNNNNNKSSNIK